MVSCTVSLGKIVLLAISLFGVPFLAVCDEETDPVYFKAEVQSCSGCSLNRLPEVKKFIFEDIPNYKDVIFKHIQGAIPELVLYSEHYKEVERIPLKSLSREQCNNLLKKKGFRKKTENPEKEL